jgi:hypothetical protein
VRRPGRADRRKPLPKCRLRHRRGGFVPAFRAARAPRPRRPSRRPAVRGVEAGSRRKSHPERSLLHAARWVRSRIAGCRGVGGLVIVAGSRPGPLGSGSGRGVSGHADPRPSKAEDGPISRIPGGARNRPGSPRSPRRPEDLHSHHPDPADALAGLPGPLKRTPRPDRPSRSPGAAAGRVARYRQTGHTSGPPMPPHSPPPEPSGSPPGPPDSRREPRQSGRMTITSNRTYPAYRDRSSPRQTEHTPPLGRPPGGPGRESAPPGPAPARPRFRDPLYTTINRAWSGPDAARDARPPR